MFHLTMSVLVVVTSPFEDLCITSIALFHHISWIIVVRMNCHHHVESLCHENLFYVKYWMSTGSFNKLLFLLCPALQLNDKYAVMTGKETICCKIMLHCMICYIAGSSYHDICTTVFISKTSFYHLVWHTIDCINMCQALDVKLPKVDELDYFWEGFKRIPTDGLMNGCVWSTWWLSSKNHCSPHLQNAEILLHIFLDITAHMR